VVCYIIPWTGSRLDPHYNTRECFPLTGRSTENVLERMPAARTITPSPPASIHSVEVVQVEDDNHSDANERTSLLGSSSRNDAGSAAKVYVTTKKNGRVAKPASVARRPATLEQEAARVQAGQRVSKVSRLINSFLHTDDPSLTIYSGY